VHRFLKPTEGNSLKNLAFNVYFVLPKQIKMKIYILPLAAAIMMSSCNSSSDKSSTGTDSTAATTEKKVTRLDPSQVDVNKPIDAVEANFQINCWDTKKAEVAGYGYVFYGDSLETKSGLYLTDSMGSTKKLVDCRFVNPPAMAKIAKTDIIHIKGRISGNSFDAITMDSCEIVAVAKSIPTQPVDPWGKAVMNANELYKDYYKWNGKEIAVIGQYYMTTTSTTSSGKFIRVDLKNPATNDKVVGCDFKEDPTEKIRVNEAGVIIKGKVKTYTPYGYLTLEDCSLVNR